MEVTVSRVGGGGLQGGGGGGYKAAGGRLKKGISCTTQPLPLWHRQCMLKGSASIRGPGISRR